MNKITEIEFIRRTERAWRSYERKEFKSQSVNNFLHDLEKC